MITSTAFTNLTVHCAQLCLLQNSYAFVTVQNIDTVTPPYTHTHFSQYTAYQIGHRKHQIIYYVATLTNDFGTHNHTMLQLIAISNKPMHNHRIMTYVYQFYSN